MVRKVGVLILMVGMAVFFFSCKSAPQPAEEPEVTEVPEEKPPEKPPEEKPPEVTEKPAEKPAEKPVEKPKPVPVADAEIQQARNAIARAKEASADYYEPQALQEAERALRQALAVRESDPEAARQYLAEAKARANAAFDGSVAKASSELAARMKRARDYLLRLQADKFLPSEYNSAVAGIPQAEQLYREGKLLEARDKAYATLAAMAGLTDRLQERLRWLEILKRDVNQYLDQAKQMGAYSQVPDRMDNVNRLYLAGVEAFQRYDLSKAEENLGAAREAILAAIKVAKGQIQEARRKSKELMLDVMKDIEAASELTVVTEDGTVVEPEKWSGQEFLEQEDVQIEDQGGPESALPPSLRIPSGGGTAVMGDLTDDNLLAQAKELWRQGVLAWNKGDYQLAEEYFAQSRKLVEVYKTQAVNASYPIYVVRLIPERRDCLWRIAEYDYIYGDPYLWPKIWRRNRKLIQHPDLIYPGWKLVIPPE